MILAFIVIVVVAFLMKWILWMPQQLCSGSVERADVQIDDTMRRHFLEKIQQKKQGIASGDLSNPDVALNYLLIGIDYETLGEFCMAENAFKEAATTDSDNPIPWSNLGSLYQKMDQNDLALDAFKKALSIDETSVLTWSKLLEFYQYRIRVSPSEIGVLYKQAFKATNDDYSLHLQYIRYLEEIGIRDAVVQEWDYLLKKNPKDERAQKELKRFGED